MSGHLARTAPATHIHHAGAPREIALKRAREAPAPHDGMRVLIDRLWPRGLTKDRVAADLWLKDAAPSETLRRWFAHDPRRWDAFARKYRAELAERDDLLALLDGLRERERLTLVYDARDSAHNNAVVLRDVLEERSHG